MFRFYADSMFGKLTRFLRFLGYDTLYRREETIEEMIKESKENGRIVLSSSQSVVSSCKKQQTQSIHLTLTDISDQLQYIKGTLNLSIIVPPTAMRCSRCNGSLSSRNKVEIIDRILEGTAKKYEEFWECDSCSKVYWLGSHWTEIKKTIKKLE